MVSSNVYPQRDRPVCLETERQTGVSGNRETDQCVWKQREDQCVWKQREDQCVWRAKSRWREERVRDLGWPSAACGSAGVVLKHQREPLEGSNMRIDFVYVLHPSLWLVWGMDCLRGNREISEEVLAIVQEETATA